MLHNKETVIQTKVTTGKHTVEPLYRHAGILVDCFCHCSDSSSSGSGSRSSSTSSTSDSDQDSKSARKARKKASGGGPVFLKVTGLASRPGQFVRIIGVKSPPPLDS